MMQEETLLDLIYYYIVALDNDQNTTEMKTKIISKLKSCTKGKIPIHHFLLQCINSIRERRTMKEIGNLIMLNLEEENLFYEDYLASKEKLNYYNHIYLPSLYNSDLNA